MFDFFDFNGDGKFDATDLFFMDMIMKKVDEEARMDDQFSNEDED